jgi:hypothetical protein
MHVSLKLFVIHARSTAPHTHTTAWFRSSVLLLLLLLPRPSTTPRTPPCFSHTISSIMEDAAARRERLKALKAAQQLMEGGGGGGEGDASTAADNNTAAGGDAAAGSTGAAAAAEHAADKPVLKFRNYAVKDDKHIQHEKVRLVGQRAAAARDDTPSLSAQPAAADLHTLQVAPAQPPKLAADMQLGTKPEEADEEVCACWPACAHGSARRRCVCRCAAAHTCPLFCHARACSSHAACACRAAQRRRHPQELLASMAPKKANWDLKREIEPRLAKLERRTQRALAEILLAQEQERLQEEGGAAD